MLSTLALFNLPSDVHTKLEDMGIDDSNYKKRLNLDRLMRAGVKEAKAEDILEDLGITTAAPGTTSETIRVVLDKGEKPVKEMDDPEELLSVLVSATRTPFEKKVAAQELNNEGRRIVVNKDNLAEVLTADTLTFWRKGNSRMTHWGVNNHPIVSATDLFKDKETVEIDPFEWGWRRRRVVLVDGYNSESGANWAQVPAARRALLVAAARKGELAANGDSVTIAEALSAEKLSAAWTVLWNRRNQEELEIIERELNVPLNKIPTPNTTPTTASAPTSPLGE